MRYSMYFTKKMNNKKKKMNTKVITKKLPSEQYATDLSTPLKRISFQLIDEYIFLNTFKFRTLKGRVKQFRSKSLRLDYILFNLFRILLIVALRWILLISKK